jgi:hypothetical protein
MMMKRILVGLGRTPFTTVAIRRSVELAKLHDAQLSSPKDQLLPEADSWQADLICVGSGARSLLLRRLFGDTALQLIRNSDRPLFLAQ